jgi:aryl-alcohol dehydrogenase-like predicted oxidoreductase
MGCPSLTLNASLSLTPPTKKASGSGILPICTATVKSYLENGSRYAFNYFNKIEQILMFVC